MTQLEINRRQAVLEANLALKAIEDLLPIAKATGDIENWANHYTAVFLLKLRVVR
jgi:hypothetical protein